MFGWWFKGSGLPDPEVIDWLFATYRWLLRETGGVQQFRRRTTLILPAPPFYAIPPGLDDEERAEALFEATRANAGMEDWPVKLVPHDESEQDFQRSLGQRTHGAAGTFRRGARRPVITYAPSILRDETTFVATMAHELGHYYNSDFDSAAPGGEAGYEPATDITAVFLGFGIFMANRTFHHDAQGISQLGYLDEKVLSYALAIFLALHELPVPAKHLEANPRAYIKDALADLEAKRTLQLQRLRGI